MVFYGFFIVFSKNWMSKNWKSIGTSITEFIDGHPSLIFIDGPSMIIIHGPSMKMVPLLWAPFFGPFFGLFFGAFLSGLSFGGSWRQILMVGVGGRATNPRLLVA
jgi:hypothetical protein